MTEAFPLYEKVGVATASKSTSLCPATINTSLNWYYRTAELAAKHHLMLDFHGAAQNPPAWSGSPGPTSWATEAAVLGMEQSKAGARDNPDNHLMLPFTRMLTGPMDYTPGGFRNVTRANFRIQKRPPRHNVMGTALHHLAMYVTYFAPFQMVSGRAAGVRKRPEFPILHQSTAPPTWDETHVINGIVGQYIAIARRKGDDWYVGVMNAGYARELIFPLKFLSPGPYTAETYSDTDDSSSSPQHVNIESKTFTSNDQLHLYIQNDGGYAAHFHVARATSP